MNGLRSQSRLRIAVVVSATAAMLVCEAVAEGPLAAKINITPLAIYTASHNLPKPEKILIYDFAVNADDVQVDKIQAMRPRHLLTGDKSQSAVAAGAGKKYYAELVKALEKTGIPVEHVAAGTPTPDNAMAVQGSFTSLKEGSKAERDSIGMGAGGAQVQTKVMCILRPPQTISCCHSSRPILQRPRMRGQLCPQPPG